jgi:Icc-related predicted phosphoesterase
MRVAATCDLHYDLLTSARERQGFEDLLAALAAERPDVLVLAGDVVGLGWNKLGECLKRFSQVSPTRLLVFGNHEHWCADRRSLSHLNQLRDVIIPSGFHLLDSAPFVTGQIGFAGNSLWYDYSLARRPPGQGNDYAGKIYQGRLAWNDAQFVALGMSDGHYAGELLSRLERDIDMLAGKTEKIVAVTHHLGFLDLLPPLADDPGVSFCDAYMGTRRLGELLLSRPKVKVHVCGHSHVAARLNINGLEVVNPGSTYKEKKYALFEIE